MGGVVVLLLHKKETIVWKGAVLVAPMCKVLYNNKPIFTQSKISIYQYSSAHYNTFNTNYAIWQSSERKSIILW